MKVVITGGAGFIGSHISEYWSKNGAEVHVIDNLRTGYQKNIKHLKSINFHNGSITDAQLVNRVLENTDYVFNLAALVSVPESLQKPQECVNINVIGLLNILEAAKNHGVQKVVHTSSAAVYGDDPELPKRVSMNPAPKTPYSITKLDGEYYCNMYKNEFSMNTVSLRYFNVFGPRQDPKSQYAAAVPIFIHKAIKNETIKIFGDGTQTRDFIFVRDVVKANVLAAEKLDARGVYNVANGNSISILELAEIIIDLTGSKSNIEFADERPGDIKHSIASIEETIKDLKFQPLKKLKHEIAETILFFEKTII
ncbi:MAG: NAD-dependent epimerase/dehydratase family protein [Bacteroidetes bacterium]|nr:NAD-dependent epimerase/dehydratase family protein [Bacteroidota bacterium]MBU1678218.1 NAD-dependent epimerase/dehydratase family protein [Bacteroidota bacterium]MBU2507518.1 NAD-dependent epimerase/dehydratase family protein [Bacteroidota bacterium]